MRREAAESASLGLGRLSCPLTVIRANNEVRETALAAFGAFDWARNDTNENE